jgi:hypothetical protein
MPRQPVSDLVEDFAEIGRLSESGKSIAFSLPSPSSLQKAQSVQADGDS